MDETNHLDALPLGIFVSLLIGWPIWVHLGSTTLFTGFGIFVAGDLIMIVVMSWQVGKPYMVLARALHIYQLSHQDLYDTSSSTDDDT